MLAIRNLKQKKFNKRISHKFIKSFRFKSIIKTQIYYFILFIIYRIYNTFYILLLKLY